MKSLAFFVAFRKKMHKIEFFKNFEQVQNNI